ncbi:type 1 glutamine amidotransferase-like domain-containing protein [Phycicoccus sp. HDW14]|uniref:Type 1 glutamine amidotransferase-like domain-containing protein n=1 Tax=Phycicoccus sp. HDW14 TaxID=2714941 RepID=UPI00140B8CC0|nr:Type 1 glutamine amidotransferase-like domain-containing protein [Phycicoccus sp. HDW14]QIM20661.1 type 1 glutamine amidotransferase-like domain-containing protein [Phycicoccus sp. HDW14]
MTPDRPHRPGRPRRPRTLLGSCLVITALLAAPLGAGTAAASVPTGGGHGHGHPSPGVLVPIGGGYETDTLEAFARSAAAHASGPTVDLVVVPAAYGDAPEDRAENLELAGERAEQLRAACEDAVPARFTGCTARLDVLLDRADALDPANDAALADPATDGVYVLGGDQGLAMQVLADSPAEKAMSAASARGVVVGGTSAGAAVESRSMINGYVGDLGPAEGLRRGSTLMWWGDDSDLERGLAFGSTRAIYDQHFHQRGRLGRTLSTLATADEHFRGRSPVGVGVDYGTGVRATGDRTLSGVFGQGSVSVVDLETMCSTHAWGGALQTLSARRVLTHLMTEDQTYDLRTRTLTRGHATIAPPRGTPWRVPHVPGKGTLVLGGGVLGSPVLDDVVARARAVDASTRGRLVVLGLGDGAATLGAEYADAARAAGWTGSVRVVTGDAVREDALRGATAAFVVGDDPASLGPALADRRVRAAVTTAVRRTPVVLTDGAVTGVVGERWSPVVRPSDDDLEDAGIAAFRADDARWQRGLGLVDATLVPHLASDNRWGRLYGSVAVDRRTPAIGVLDHSAVVLTSRGASTLGESVVVADGDEARTWTSANGSIGAANVLLDVFADGERLRR